MKKHTYEALAKRRRLERTTQLIRELPTASPLCAHCNKGAHRTEGNARGVHERRCPMQTNNSHVFASDALLSNTIHTETETNQTTQHHEDHLVAVRTSHPRHCLRIVFNGVACRTFKLEIAARFRPNVTCVEFRKCTEGPNCVSELANQRSKHVHQLTCSASFLATVQAIAEPHTLFEQRAKMIETTTNNRNAKSRKNIICTSEHHRDTQT